MALYLIFVMRRTLKNPSVQFVPERVPRTMRHVFVRIVGIIGNALTSPTVLFDAVIQEKAEQSGRRCCNELGELERKGT